MQEEDKNDKFDDDLDVHGHDQNSILDDVEEDDDFNFQKKKNKIFLILVIVVFGGAAYYFLSKTTSEDKKVESNVEKKQRIDTLIKNADTASQENAPRISLQDQTKDSFSLPDSVELPSLPTPEIRAPSTRSNNIPAPNPPLQKNNIQSRLPFPPESNRVISPPIPQKKRVKQGKTTGSMFAISGGSVTGEGKVDDKKVNNVVDLSNVPDSGATRTITSRMTDLRATIAQGKILKAVLETAISSDLDGTLRGIITSDVYSETGKLILIPKGSRLIGKYSFEGSFGSQRINVTWNRVIMPHGFDISVDSLGVDTMGRSGVSGVVDDKLGNILTSTILMAAVSIGTASAVSKIPGLDSQVVQSSDASKPGITTTTSSTSSQVVSQSLEDVSSSMKDLIKRYADTKPTLYVDQGTAVNVLVSQDIVFPWETIADTAKIIN